MTITAKDQGIQLEADASRVLARMFMPGESIAPLRPRAEVIIDRVQALDDDEARRIGSALVADFSPRHHDLSGILDEHAKAAIARTGDRVDSASPQYIVLGAAFTQEYAVEGAALCNPSVAPHPDQSGLAAGELRIVVSLREIGEGHVSSLGFVSAVVTRDSWSFDARQSPLRTAGVQPSQGSWSSYEAEFPSDSGLSQRVLLPVIGSERNGIEDARLVRFTDAAGHSDYRATYTAYDGSSVSPRLLVSDDLVTFTSHPLTGAAATNKGVALFPRLVNGEHLALVRSDGETNSLARSPDGVAWGHETAVRVPSFPWELVLSGNCGSPIETDKGWLVLTHGVGPMRVYSMSAILLDLDDPTIVLGALQHPLITSDGSKQNGYVPNVVYSCGSIEHDGTVWIPYGVGDNRIRVASVPLAELLDALLA
ncbi:MAG: glycosylase [Pseudolysinimonas sp.]